MALTADMVEELSSLGLTGPQYQAVLSILSRLERKNEERKERDRLRKIRGNSSETVTEISPLNKNKTPLASVANATAQPVKDLVWTEGVRKLIALGGLQERAARSNVGRWLKNNPAGIVMDAIDSAEKAGTRDPIPYVTKALQPKVIALARDWEVGAKRQIAEREDTRKETPEERAAHVERRLGRRQA